jgi:hypothetical protein
VPACGSYSFARILYTCADPGYHTKVNCQEFEGESASYDLFWDQLRVGATYYNVVGVDFETVEATSWFVVLYLPIFPLQRVRLQKSADGWQNVRTTKLHWSLLIGTYIKAYVLGGLMLFGPAVPLVSEVYVHTGLDPRWQVPGIALWIVWFVVFIWKSADLHESSFERAVRDL